MSTNTALPSHPLCAGCAPGTGAPDTVYHSTGPTSVHGRVRLHDRHQGWSQVAHGGVVALTLDEGVGSLLTSMNVLAVTARLDITYVSPCPIGLWLDVESHVVSHQGRRWDIEVTLTRPGVDRAIATARATALVIPSDHPEFKAPAG